MNYQFFRTNAIGVAVSIVIALLAIYLNALTGFNTILIALLLGIILGNVIRIPESFNIGIKISSSLFLELAIVLMALSIDYGRFLALGWETILIVTLTIIVILWATIQLGKKMNCPSSAGLLVGFGTAICGSSAIAALAPSVSKDKSDIGIAMAVVNLYGLTGMLVLPLLTQEYFSEIQNGVLLGTSLHSVGNVAGAGFGMSEAIGELAVTVKLGRVALLTPALLVFGHFTSLAKDKTTSQNLALPWYLIAFIVISIVVSLISVPSEILTYSKQGSNFLLAIAMAAIGIKVSFKTLLSSGKKGLIFGGILFIIQLAVIGILIFALGI
ncbi:putative sulfate exporter family transporter [Bacteroidia bacterium]|nr:putative sulfate exporter family transporter [Bacteroidia bacterium]